MTNIDALTHQLATALRAMNVELADGNPVKPNDRPHIVAAKEVLAAYDEACTASVTVV